MCGIETNTAYNVYTTFLTSESPNYLCLIGERKRRVGVFKILYNQ
nr:MAG TPA: hypothetical protein [Caudoviricetes sp.]